MRKLSVLLCLFIVICISQIWAEGKQEEKEVREELTFWSLQQADIDIKTAQENAVESFEKKNNCDVEVTPFPYVELRDKLLTAVAGGQGPDILILDQIWVAQYAASNFVEPLDDLIKNSDIKAEDYFPGAWGAGNYQGKMYAVPFDVGVWAVMYYNKDLFKEAGLSPDKPPVTWNEFIDYGEKISKLGDDIYGTAIWVAGGDAVNCMTDAFTFSKGGKIVNETGNKALLNSPEGISALNFWKDCSELSPAGTVGRTVEDSFKLFTADKVGMFFYGEWGQDTINTRAPDMNYGVALLPKPEGGRSIGCFGGFNLGINKKTQNKDLAWEFIKYTTKTEVNKNITMLTPANKEAAEVYLEENRRFPEIIYQQLSTALYRPLVPNYPKIAEIQKNATEKALLGELSTKEALNEAANEINKLLK
jgi:ABC-type glycerol-3-phosphate transport system substrate-binding protein